MLSILKNEIKNRDEQLEVVNQQKEEFKTKCEQKEEKLRQKEEIIKSQNQEMGEMAEKLKLMEDELKKFKAKEQPLFKCFQSHGCLLGFILIILIFISISIFYSTLQL